MFEWMADPQAWVTLVTLTFLEIVLGIDNIIFVAILVGKVEKPRQGFTRRVGLLGAMGTRILLLLGITWVMELTAPLFTVAGRAITGKSLILIAGGVFLLFKSTFEIHDKLEGEEGTRQAGGASSVRRVLVQIMLLDIVFSLDSVITAVGMAQQVAIMIAAVVVSVFIMMFFARSIGEFVDRHPTMKMLALSFLLLIGFTLVLDGLGQHIQKGYIYTAMAFSFFVELLNIKLRKRQTPVQLHGPVVSAELESVEGEGRSSLR